MALSITAYTYSLYNNGSCVLPNLDGMSPIEELCAKQCANLSIVVPEAVPVDDYLEVFGGARETFPVICGDCSRLCPITQDQQPCKPHFCPVQESFPDVVTRPVAGKSPWGGASPQIPQNNPFS